MATTAIGKPRRRTCRGGGVILQSQGNLIKHLLVQELHPNRHIIHSFYLQSSVYLFLLHSMASHEMCASQIPTRVSSLRERKRNFGAHCLEESKELEEEILKRS